MNILEHVSLCLCGIFEHFFSWQKFIKSPAVVAPTCMSARCRVLLGEPWTQNDVEPICSQCWSDLGAPCNALQLLVPLASRFVQVLDHGLFQALFISQGPYPTRLSHTWQMTRLLVFLRKMRSSTESSLNPSAPNFSAFPLRKMVNMFCKSQILYGMNGGRSCFSFLSLSDPRLELHLTRSCIIFRITNSNTPWPQPPNSSSLIPRVFSRWWFFTFPEPAVSVPLHPICSPLLVFSLLFPIHPPPAPTLDPSPRALLFPVSILGTFLYFSCVQYPVCFSHF